MKSSGRHQRCLTPVLAMACLCGITFGVAAAGQDAMRESLKRQRVAELMKEGMTAYRNSDIETAAARWREVLLIDPENDRARIYLKEISTELARVEQERAQDEEATKREEEARRKLDEKVSVELREGIRLRELLNTLSFISGLNFVIVEGADVSIAAKFENTPVREILDTALEPSGLSWSRKGNIVTVSPQIRTRVFSVDSDLFLKLRRLYDAGELQRILWNADAPPLEAVRLTLDDRQSAVILNDSPANVEKLENLIAELRHAPVPRLATRIYSVRSDVGQDVKVLVEAMLRTHADTAIDLNRRVILAEHGEATDLIVRDTESNLRFVEDLLTDRAFLRHLENDELEVYTTNLTPRDVFEADQESVESFGQDIKEVIETILYHEDGIEAARAQGRRLWYDAPTLQLTITDYPSNIRKVSEFVQSLPQLEPKSRSKIIFLEYALASEVVSKLEDILGISRTGGAAAGGAGTEASFSLRVEDERIFNNDLSIRLVRVDENTYGDDNDDSCELVVRTRTAQSSDLTITEYRSEVFEEYEIYVEEVDPSPTPGEGRVRLRVSYLPAVGAPYP